MSNNNKIILEGCIEQFKTINEITKTESEIFELFSLIEINKTYDLSFEEIESSIVDGGNDGGIDSIIVRVDDITPLSIEDLDDQKFSRHTQAVIIISQCKKENSFKESSLDKLIASIPELFNLENRESELLLRFNPNVVEKALLAREVWTKCSISGGTLKITYNYCCIVEKIEINAAFKSKVEQLKKITSSTFSNTEIEYYNYSSQELLKLYQAQRNQRLSLKYKENPLSTSYNGGIGYVGTVILSDYKDFLKNEDQEIRDELFESNIRHFQGQVDVNKKIKKTIENPSSEDFWWLNNGITIIAEKPSLVGTILSIDNVQIVNGLQTSYSIFYNYNVGTVDLRSVLVKVIINDNKATVDHIIASTNSQNPVSAALLRATDEIQRELELFFLNQGYYYDRRKNYYKNQGKPVNKIFGIQSTAQAIETLINSNPHSARSKPTTLMKEDKTYNAIFDPKRSFKSYLNSCLIVKQTSDFFSTIDDQILKSQMVNFKMHLSRIAASVVLGKKYYSTEDLEKYKFEDYSVDNFKKAVEYLSTSILNYMKENSDVNLINMAKTKAFTDFMIKGL